MDRSPVHTEDNPYGGVLSRVLGFLSLKRGQRIADARSAILLGCVGAAVVVLAFCGRWMRKRMAPPIGSVEFLGFSLAIMFLVSYALWEKVWSIYRYVAIQESLSGVLVLAALPIVFGSRCKPWLKSGLFALIAVATFWMTHYPWWDRVQQGRQAIYVQLPPFEPNAIVLFLDPPPYSYLVPSMPSSARAIGVNNGLVHPGSAGKLWSIIEATVRDHQGPLWGVEDPKDFPGVADVSLSSLGLARGGECAPLATNGARAAGKDLQAATEVNASGSPSMRTAREDLQAATGVNASALLSAVRMELGSPDISSTRVPKEARSECR